MANHVLHAVLCAAHEIAAAMCFLACGEPSFAIRATLSIDAGLLALLESCG
jgi:hypothetical protein